MALATALQGASRAVSDIVLSRGRVESTALYESDDYDLSIMPPVAYHNIVRHYSGEYNEFMFTAHPDIGLGAYMSMSSCTPTSSNLLYKITIPNDHKIDELLMQEPHSWEHRFQYAMDFRTGQPIASRPFHHDLCDEGANWRYITILQTLTRQLLAITNR